MFNNRLTFALGDHLGIIPDGLPEVRALFDGKAMQRRVVFKFTVTTLREKGHEPVERGILFLLL